MSRPVHFELQVDDVERAKAFYAAVFGWQYQDWSSVLGSTYWGITTGAEGEPGINGGLQPRPAPVPDNAGTNSAVLTMQVDDYDAVERKVLDAGGRVALPKFAMPGMAWQGYYLDPEGNTFGIHQPDPTAA
jgi:uncharacterized protein